ncbi:hypothetical protein F442_03900, partial [Phytophthora nicotianae P10297]
MAHNYNLQQLRHFDFSAVMEATTDESKAVAWAMEVGLLERSMLCPQCAQPMRLNARMRYWRSCRKTRHADGRALLGESRGRGFFQRGSLPVTSCADSYRLCSGTHSRR